MTTENFPPEAPGAKTRWFQGFVALLANDFRQALLGTAVGGSALGAITFLGIVSVRSAIIGVVGSLILWMFLFAYLSLRVSRNPFAVYAYNEWVEEQEAGGVSILEQDWYHWFRKTQPQYKYITSPKRIAQYTS